MTSLIHDGTSKHLNEMPRESKKKRGENDDDLWETPTFSLTDKRVRALARLSGLGIPEYDDEPNCTVNYSHHVPLGRCVRYTHMNMRQTDTQVT